MIQAEGFQHSDHKLPENAISFNYLLLQNFQTSLNALLPSLFHFAFIRLIPCLSWDI